jgi:hypothetical protein
MEHEKQVCPFKPLTNSAGKKVDVSPDKVAERLYSYRILKENN